MKGHAIYGLVCAGGGAHGAYQVGALKYIHEKFCDGHYSPFRIFTGASCGSLNTSFYAAQSYDAHKSRLWLEELWRGFHVPAYHGNILKNAAVSLYKEWRRKPHERNGSWAILDPGPMNDVIDKGYLRAHLEKSFAAGSTRGIGVAATELLSGRVCWFQEGPVASNWNLFHSIGIVERILRDHISASCSVPVFLPPVKIGPWYFVDGSVSLDRPFTAAISMGATRILSIATDKPYPSNLPKYSSSFRPRLTNVLRLLLNRLGHDAANDEAALLEILNRFHHALSHKARRDGNEIPALPLFHEESMPGHYKPVKTLLLFPSKRIRERGGLDNEAHATTRRHRTRFMFHEKFIGELIGLGYEDAKARHDELKHFFQPLPAPHTRRRWALFRSKKESHA